MPRLETALAALLALSRILALPGATLPGEVSSEQKISDTAGGFGGVLAGHDRFGAKRPSSRLAPDVSDGLLGRCLLRHGFLLLSEPGTLS